VNASLPRRTPPSTNTWVRVRARVRVRVDSNPRVS
jgi:hypothetical protein